MKQIVQLMVKITAGKEINVTNQDRPLGACRISF